MIMIKLKAKKLLVGSQVKTFFSLFLPKLLSLFSLAVIFLCFFALSDRKTLDLLGSLPAFSSSWTLASATFVICLFCGFLFAVGRKRFAFNSVKKSRFNADLSEENGSFKKTAQFLLMSATKLLLSLAWGFLFFLPATVSAALLLYSVSSGEVTENMLYIWATGCIVLALVGFAFTFVTLQRYSMWAYFLCDKNETVFSSFSKSLSLTEGKMMSIAFFKMSLFPWIISCVLILPIIYVLPYYDLSVALLFNSLSGEKKQPQPRPFTAVFRVIKSQ